MIKQITLSLSSSYLRLDLRELSLIISIYSGINIWDWSYFGFYEKLFADTTFVVSPNFLNSSVIRFLWIWYQIENFLDVVWAKFLCFILCYFYFITKLNFLYKLKNFIFNLNVNLQLFNTKTWI